MLQFNNLIIRNITAVLIILIFSYMLLPWLNPAVGHLSQQILRKSTGYLLDYQTGSYAVLEGERFIVKYQAQDADMAPYILEMAETFYDQVRLGLGYNKADNAKALLIIYPDEITLQKGFGWEGDKSAVGVYWSGHIRILSPRDWLKGENPEDIRQAFREQNPLAHEITHLLVDKQTGGNYTRWLTEGLAQYLERELTGYTLDEPSGQEKSRPVLLKAIEERFDDPRSQTMAYWQSMQTVKYLIEYHGMEAMQEFLKHLGRGENMEKVLIAVYGLDLRALDSIMGERYKRQS